MFGGKLAFFIHSHRRARHYELVKTSSDQHPLPLAKGLIWRLRWEIKVQLDSLAKLMRVRNGTSGKLSPRIILVV